MQRTLLNLSRGFAAAIAATSLSLSAWATGGGEWEQIFLNGPIEATLPDGSTQTVDPACTGGPKLLDPALGPAPGNIVPADKQYSFFVRRGNPFKVVFFVDGGGACWNGLTCLGSPLTGDGTYSPEVDETPESLAQGQGVADNSNRRNPYRNYTQVFLPYCSGDIHWGSRDTTYQFSGLPPWTIHHRGTDNFLAALDWINKNGRQEYGLDIGRAYNVSVAGLSAGGYGAQLVYAYVAESARRFARLSLISDAAVGVVTEPFYREAIYDSDSSDPGNTESWGVAENLPPWVPGLDEALLAQVLASGNPSSLVRGIFAALSDYKPRGRLSSVTTNLDEVQIAFFALQKGVDLTDPVALFQTAQEWYATAALELILTASLGNYRFYLEDGTFHTFLFSDEAVYEKGSFDIALARWVRAQLTPGTFYWQNLDAGPPQ